MNNSKSSRLASALNYLQQIANMRGESTPDDHQQRLGLQGDVTPSMSTVTQAARDFGGGVATNLGNRARDIVPVVMETVDPRPLQARPATMKMLGDVASIGKAIVTDPINTGKSIVSGEAERAKLAMNNPRSMGEYTGSFIDPLRIASALSKRPSIAEIDAYHGTANDFDAFDIKNRGKSTGAQSAKEATWFVDKPEVAKGYAVFAAESAPVLSKLKEADKLETIAKRTNNKKDWDNYDKALSEAEELDKSAYTRRQEQSQVLKVDIPDKTNFLEIDAGNKTPQELSNKSDIDSWLNLQLKKAKLTNKQGIKITNLDDAAGLTGIPATHYAVFDPSGVKIINKTKLSKVERK